MNIYFGVDYSWSFDISMNDPRWILSTTALFGVFLILRYGVPYLIFRRHLRAIKGRNVVVTQYTAPPDIPPALFGSIIDNRPALADLPATALHLLLNGYIEMKYDAQRQDFNFIVTRKVQPDSLYEHQKFVLKLLDGIAGTWLSELRERINADSAGFSLAVWKDLQQDGYYKFGSYIRPLNSLLFVLVYLVRAFFLGLIKPWNWPGILLCLTSPILCWPWLFVCAVYYNRLGIYKNRTSKWEKVWPELAGYYNYLRIVEAERRTFELRDFADFKPNVHDPYLVAAGLQPKWNKLFFGTAEIGAGGKDYHTV